MTKLHRTYFIAMEIELEAEGSNYEDCRSLIRDKLKHEINKLVYSQDYTTEITDEWEEEEE